MKNGILREYVHPVNFFARVLGFILVYIRRCYVAFSAEAFMHDYACTHELKLIG